MIVLHIRYINILEIRLIPDENILTSEEGI